MLTYQHISSRDKCGRRIVDFLFVLVMVFMLLAVETPRLSFHLFHYLLIFLDKFFSFRMIKKFSPTIHLPTGCVFEWWKKRDLLNSNDFVSFLTPLCRRIFEANLVLSELSWSGVTKDVTDGSVNLTKCSFKQLGNVMSLIRSKLFFVEKN